MMAALQDLRVGKLVLLHAGLDQAEVICLEALETAECPLALVVLGSVLVRAWLHLCAHIGLVAALSQLLSQVVHVEALRLVEESHLGQNTLNVASIGVLKLPLLKLLHLLRGNVQGRYALSSILNEVLASLNAPVGVGLGRWG